VGATGQLRAQASPPDELILAAVRRAQLHAPPGRAGVPIAAVRAHLSLAPRTAQGRALGGRLEGLRDQGLLSGARAHGVPIWALSPGGRRRLKAAERRGEPLLLPESPQHASWRQARRGAAAELDRFASQLRADIRQAEAMLEALEAGDGAPHSDRWLAQGRRLLGDCRRLGSAWHCLHEWPEPQDASADRDEERAPDGSEPSPALRAMRAGRRNITLWSEPH
jgi:hypothetical protein